MKKKIKSMKLSKKKKNVKASIENIKHLIDDLSLFKAMFYKLKNGGPLLLTKTNFYYKSINDSDNGLLEKSRMVGT